jgi:hypothetical protein
MASTSRTTVELAERAGGTRTVARRPCPSPDAGCRATSSASAAWSVERASARRSGDRAASAGHAGEQGPQHPRVHEAWALTGHEGRRHRRAQRERVARKARGLRPLKSAEVRGRPERGIADRTTPAKVVIAPREGPETAATRSSIRRGPVGRCSGTPPRRQPTSRRLARRHPPAPLARTASGYVPFEAEPR